MLLHGRCVRALLPGPHGFEVMDVEPPTVPLRDSRGALVPSSGDSAIYMHEFNDRDQEERLQVAPALFICE